MLEVLSNTLSAICSFPLLLLYWPPFLLSNSSPLPLSHFSLTITCILLSLFQSQPPMIPLYIPDFKLISEGLNLEAFNKRGYSMFIFLTTSLNMIFFGFIHLPEKFHDFFFFFWIESHSVCTTFSLSILYWRMFRLFPSLAIVNRTVMSIVEHVSVE